MSLFFKVFGTVVGIFILIAVLMTAATHYGERWETYIRYDLGLDNPLGFSIFLSPAVVFLAAIAGLAAVAIDKEWG